MLILVYTVQLMHIYYFAHILSNSLMKNAHIDQAQQQHKTQPKELPTGEGGKRGSTAAGGPTNGE